MIIEKYPRLRQLRKESGLSQDAIGKILHISQRAYGHYEDGTRRVPLEILCAMADFYNTSIDYLVGFTDEKKRH